MNAPSIDTTTILIIFVNWVCGNINRSVRTGPTPWLKGNTNAWPCDSSTLNFRMILQRNHGDSRLLVFNVFIITLYFTLSYW